jgi:hypothetical protein
MASMALSPLRVWLNEGLLREESGWKEVTALAHEQQQHLPRRSSTAETVRELDREAAAIANMRNEGLLREESGWKEVTAVVLRCGVDAAAAPGEPTPFPAKTAKRKPGSLTSSSSTSRAALLPQRPFGNSIVKVIDEGAAVAVDARVAPVLLQVQSRSDGRPGHARRRKPGSLTSSSSTSRAALLPQRPFGNSIVKLQRLR